MHDKELAAKISIRREMAEAVAATFTKVGMLPISTEEKRKMREAILLHRRTRSASKPV